MPLFEASGLAGQMDDGFIDLDETPPADFIASCAQLRLWSRQQHLQ